MQVHYYTRCIWLYSLSVTFTSFSLLPFCNTNLLPGVNCTIIFQLRKHIHLSLLCLIHIPEEPLEVVLLLI